MPRTERIETPRLILEPFAVEAVTDRYVSWLNDPAVVRFSEQRHRTHTRKSCVEYIQSINHEQAHLWRILVQPDQHIGNISAHRDIGNRSADLAILIGERSEWGKGHGEEAWSAVMDWLLQNGADVVTAGTMEANTGMLRIFKKTGMEPAGSREGCFLFEGKRIRAEYALKRSRGVDHGAPLGK